jgi:hypothetical protein
VCGMREIVFRSLAGAVAALFLVAAALMAKQDPDPSILLIAGLGLLFAAYAALGEYKIRGLLKLIGAKDNSSRRSGGDPFGA